MKIRCLRCGDIAGPKKVYSYYFDFRFTERLQICHGCYDYLSESLGTSVIKNYVRATQQSLIDQFDRAIGIPNPKGKPEKE